MGVYSLRRRQLATLYTQLPPGWQPFTISYVRKLLLNTRILHYPHSGLRTYEWVGTLAIEICANERIYFLLRLRQPLFLPPLLVRQTSTPQ